MNRIPRDVAQTLIAKLDLKHMRPSAVKAFALKHYRVLIPGRSREQVANAIATHLRTTNTERHTAAANGEAE